MVAFSARAFGSANPVAARCASAPPARHGRDKPGQDGERARIVGSRPGFQRDTRRSDTRARGSTTEARVPQAPNIVRLTARTPRDGFNRLVVSVTICVPGTASCATIDNVMVDTGSTGLRIEASALPASLRLPPFLGPNGTPLAECLRFVHDTAWGPLVRADLHFGGLVAQNLPMQVIADGPPVQPKSCPPSQAQPTSNGTIGIGPHLTDCQGACEQFASAPSVFEMRQELWTPVQGRLAQAYRVPNPGSRFPLHNNGVILDLPRPRGGGESKVTGTLTLGVGTAADNRLVDADIVHVDGRGYFTTTYGGAAYPDSYLDSGTMTYIFRDDGLARCQRASWAFCVAPRRKLAATIAGQDGRRTTAPFVVGDYEAARDQRHGAADGVAVAGEAGTKTFVWGAPFFLGRRVALVIEGMGVPGLRDIGPFFAVSVEDTRRPGWEKP